LSRDKVYGVLIVVLSTVFLLYYTYWAILIRVFPSLKDSLPIPVPDPEWAVILPVWLALVAVLLIFIWIGWTILTTPPIEPLEEIEEEEEEKTEEESGEESKE